MENHEDIEILNRKFDIISHPPPSNFNIDSFKIRIPLGLKDENGNNLVQVFDPDISSRYITLNSETGQIVREFENTKSRHDKDGIITKYAIENISTGLHWDTFLTITVTAKHLRGSYFDGISKDNIDEVITSLLRIGAFHFSHDTFKHHGIVTDMDFCRNLIIPNWTEIKQYLIENTKESKSGKSGYIETNEPTNKGIQWSSREGATLKAPYIKIYNKGLQIKHDENMKTFARLFLDEAPDTSMYRIEYTLKNKKHFAKHGLTNRLIDLLNVPYDKREQIAKAIIREHVNGVFKQTKLYQTALNAQYPCSNRSEFLIYLLIHAYRQLGKPTTLILDEYSEFLSMRFVKSDDWNKQKIGNKRQRLHKMRSDIGKVTSRLPKEQIDTLLDIERRENQRRKDAKIRRYENAKIIQALGIIDDIEEWTYDGLSDEARMEREVMDMIDLQKILDESWDNARSIPPISIDGNEDEDDE